MRKSFSIAFIVLLSLGLVCTRPFDIYADSYMDHIVGTTYSNQKNIITWTFDEHILGSMDVTISYKLSPNGAVNQIRPYIRVNGTQVSYVIYNDWLYDVSFTIDNSYFEPVSSMDLTTIISYLSQMYDTQEDIYDQLLLICQKKQWNVPYESFSFIASVMSKNVELLDMLNYGYFNFPIYHGYQNEEFCQFWLSSSYTYKFVGITSKQVNNVNNFNANFITDNPNLTVFHYQQLSSPFTFLNTSELGYIFSVEVKSSSSRTTRFKFNSEMYFVPIYFERLDNKNISTDFALVFGLSNQLLDDLHIVANGTQASSDSSSNLEDMNDDYDDVSQQVFGLENNFSTGFDSSMQNVPTTFNFGTQFGNKFLATATWVRNQFDTMTTNTPFGALITFSLVLGLALLIVGRRLL